MHYKSVTSECFIKVTALLEYLDGAISTASNYSYHMQGNFQGMKILQKDGKSEFHDFIFTKALQIAVNKLTRLALSRIYFCETDICCKICKFSSPAYTIVTCNSVTF